MSYFNEVSRVSEILQKSMQTRSPRDVLTIQNWPREVQAARYTPRPRPAFIDSTAP
jgi:hypothetical protein